MTYLTEIKKGKLVLEPRFSDWAKRHEGRRVRIAPVSGNVSDEQRGYYFGAIIPMLRRLVPSWANAKDMEIHAVLKENFGPTFTTFDPIRGEERKISISIASNGKSHHKRMEEFLTRLGQWVAENYGEQLPDPEDYKRERDSAPLRGPLTPVMHEKHV